MSGISANKKRDSQGALKNTPPKAPLTAADLLSSMLSAGNADRDITVMVGPEKEAFHLHSTVICATSGYFRVACSPQFLEGQTRVIELTEMDPEIFRKISEWLYSVHYELPIKNNKVVSSEVVSLYKAADYLDIDQLMTMIRVAVRDCVKAEGQVQDQQRSLMQPLKLVQSLAAISSMKDWSELQGIMNFVLPTRQVDESFFKSILDGEDGAAQTAVPGLVALQGFFSHISCKNCVDTAVARGRSGLCNPCWYGGR